MRGELVNSTSKRIACLDGIRGVAALWVLIGHALLLSGRLIPVVSQPDLGVDLFIMLSGFLMVYHYQTEPWSDRATTLSFWTRRFFRIAPLYYVALAAAVILGPTLFEARNTVDALRGAAPQQAFRYIDGSFENVLLHVSFLFGAIPSYAFRTPLPDWSLGLEMQFYFLFPLMMLAVPRFGWARAAAAIVVTGLLLAAVLRLAHVQFPMPSFLPLKMQVFMCGMLCAASLKARPRFGLLALAASVVLIAIPIGGSHSLERLAVREVMVICFFAVILHDWIGGWLGGILRRVATLLGSPPFHWAGELSYSVYLIHLLVMIPVTAYVWTTYGNLGGSLRSLIVVAIVAPITYALSFVTFTQIERRGNRLGAAILKELGVRAKERKLTPAEKIAAP
jgi:peptidoglycan/LPS O-acetylase OafA/YrhL